MTSEGGGSDEEERDVLGPHLRDEDRIMCASYLPAARSEQTAPVSRLTKCTNLVLFRSHLEGARC